VSTRDRKKKEKPEETAPEGTTPREKLRRKDYERELGELQVELSALQAWIKRTGQRVVIVFEGRDAAGKGGTIRAITERLSPRVFQVVALPAPSDREKTQLYMQRYLQHFPAAGEVVIFDRSWYNRAGVEIVMGFSTEDERDHFLTATPWFENNLVEQGITLIKYWLEVGEVEQERRFRARIEDPVRQWKLSPMDLESRKRWFEYSRARDLMLSATDTDAAPWSIVRSDDKKRARLNVIRHLLSQFPYDPLPKTKVKLPDRDMEDAYDDQVTMADRRWIPEHW
jgi:polyphosphate kinase